MEGIRELVEDLVLNARVSSLRVLLNVACVASSCAATHTRATSVHSSRCDGVKKKKPAQKRKRTRKTATAAYVPCSERRCREWAQLAACRSTPCRHSPGTLHTAKMCKSDNGSYV